MKKVLSLILAIILTFSMTSFAFAEDTATALSKDQAKNAAIEHINYDRIMETLTYAKSGTYSHDAQGNIEVYNVTSTLIMKSGSIFVYETVIDKYTGKIYYQKATRSVLDLSHVLNINLTIDQAYDVALDVVGANKDNTTAMAKETIVTADGRDAYHFTFSEGYSLKYDCTVIKSNGAVEDIKVSQYTVENNANGFGSIIERVIHIIKVFIAKISITNLLEKVSAADLLKIFQFLSK